MERLYQLTEGWYRHVSLLPALHTYSLNSLVEALWYHHWLLYISPIHLIWIDFDCVVSELVYVMSSVASCMCSVHVCCRVHEEERNEKNAAFEQLQGDWWRDKSHWWWKVEGLGHHGIPGLHHHLSSAACWCSKMACAWKLPALRVLLQTDQVIFVCVVVMFCFFPESQPMICFVFQPTVAVISFQ